MVFNNCKGTTSKGNLPKGGLFCLFFNYPEFPDS